MKRLLLPTLSLFMLNLQDTPAASQDQRCYELRIYYSPAGKLDELHARFRNHTCKLFEKHGMVNVGYWVPIDNAENKLVYLLSYPSREARDKSWKAFMADPEWQAAWKASETNGRLVEKVEEIYLTATDYSPAIKIAASQEPRVFEMRTYKASAGNLKRLHARFRNHTVNLFSKHGMTHIGYWSPMEGEKEAADTLIYLLAHKSKDAAAASFKAFREDPDWLKARKASEEEAGGSLTVPQPEGVKSEFLKPTDYSPIK